DRKKMVHDEDLEVIVADETSSVRVSYELLQVQVSCGDHSIPTATVQLRGPGGQVMVDSDHGTGPVDAIYRAINRVTRVENELIEFSIQAVTEGIDALAEVTIRIRSNGDIYTGRGSHSDICVASARAYMHALNRLIENRLDAAGAGAMEQV
ncbi:MAG: 2-isopropylmalate synthase, partial [Chthonomonadales bacterium]|nr:2-isopropylmalate synthase [Chthonomonadales bacterium]